MARRKEYHLYKQTGSPNYYARKRRKGQQFSTCLDTSDKKVADRRAQKWVEELKGSNWGEKPDYLFSAAAEKFAKEHYRDIKYKTALRYQTSLVHLLETFATTPLSEISSASLYEFEMKRREDEVAPATIINDFRCLSAILNLAQVWEWTDKNPVPIYLTKRKKSLKAAEPRERYLSHEEEMRLLDAADTRWAMYIILAIETGMRREEQFSLMRSDIFLKERYIRIRAEVSKSSSRRIPITDRGAQVLRDLLRSHNSEYVCPRSGNDRFSPSSPHIHDNFQKLLARAAITDFRWHDLRRTYGCRCLQDRRMPIEAVSRCMGHSTVKVTEKVYAFLKIEHLKQQMEETEGRVVPITRRAVVNGGAE